MNPEGIRTQYDRIGADYIASRDKFLAKHGEPPSKLWMYRNTSDTRGKSVLDIGCGDGVALIRYAKQGAARAIGIDSSIFMVDQANERTLEAGFGRVTFALNINAEASWSYFDENSFDMVTSTFALHYIPDLDRVFENVARVLRPGGNFVYIADNHESVQEVREVIIDPITGERFSSFVLFDERVRAFIPLHRRTDYDSPTFKKYFDVVDTFEGKFEAVLDVPDNRIGVIGVNAVRRVE